MRLLALAFLCLVGIAAGRKPVRQVAISCLCKDEVAPKQGKHVEVPLTLNDLANRQTFCTAVCKVANNFGPGVHQVDNGGVVISRKKRGVPLPGYGYSCGCTETCAPPAAPMMTVQFAPAVTSCYYECTAPVVAYTPPVVYPRPVLYYPRYYPYFWRK